MAAKKSTSNPETLPRMARAEWEVMRICWRLQRPTVPEILAESTRYNAPEDYKTVQVLLARLVKKGCLRIDRTYRYNKHIPLVDHHESLRAETEHFIEEVVGRGAEEVDRVIAWLTEARDDA